MVFSLTTSTTQAIINRQATTEILKLNDLSSNFGLSLTQAQAQDLVEARAITLTNHGRIELGTGIMGKLIEVFCDSKYLNTSNYAQTLNDLLEIFYHIKAESREILMADGLISDDNIIADMKKAYETICQGSIELLAQREGAKIARSITHDYEPDFNEDSNHEGGYLDDWAGEWEQ